MIIRNAFDLDADELSVLTYKSKNYWNYGQEQIEKWKEELTISAEYIKSNEVYVLIKNEHIVGYYSYFIVDPISVKLDNLFVLPSYIGKGYGKLLLNDFLEKVTYANFQKATLDADPNAEAFYLKNGFRTIGQLLTSIENRYLPIMEKEL